MSGHPLSLGIRRAGGRERRSALGEAERADRDTLFAKWLTAAPPYRPTPKLESEDRPGVTAQVRDLAGGEDGCCSFLTLAPGRMP